MNLMKLAIGTLGFSLLAGCATITTQNAKDVTIQSSNGSPIEVSVDGGTYTTPAQVSLVKDGTNKTITTQAEGCDSTTTAPKKLEPMFFGNIIFGGLLGSTTDAGISKKGWTYDDQITVNCK